MAYRSTAALTRGVAIKASTFVASVATIVRRQYVPDARYVVSDDYFPPLADIPIRVRAF